MRPTIHSLIATLLFCTLTGDLWAQHLFIQRGNMAADALALEHMVKKLASHDTRMRTLNAALKDFADESQRFTRLAQRQGSYYALQRSFDPMIQRYRVVRNTIETASDWNQGNPRMQEWRNVQNAFDQIYTDLYGYDLLDPYFGRHPDFAAVPVPLRIPQEVLHPQVSIPQYEIHEPAIPTPYVVPSSSIIRSSGNPVQF